MSNLWCDGDNGNDPLTKFGWACVAIVMLAVSWLLIYLF